MSDPVQEIARQLHIATLGDGLMAKIRLTIDLLQEAASERDQLRATIAQQEARIAERDTALANAVQQAQAQAQEARTQRSIVMSIGELVGCANDWEMVEAVRTRLEQQRGGVVDEREAFEAWRLENFCGGLDRLKKCSNAPEVYYYEAEQSAWKVWIARARLNPPGKFRLGDPVRKTKGSQWSGRVVGFYSTEQTPDGYAVESFTEKGSVQIYPGSALEPCEEPGECVAVAEGSKQEVDLALGIFRCPRELMERALEGPMVDRFEAAEQLRAILAQQGKETDHEH